LSNQNGEEVLLEDFIDKLEWSWLFVENENIISINTTNNEITSISKVVCSKYENDNEQENTNVVKLRLGSDFDFSKPNYSIL
jgi:hypothetical protein